MISHGFDRNAYDCSVYHSKLDHGSMIYLRLYFDDMLVATKNKTNVARLKERCNSKFDTKDLAVVRKILGVKIYRDQVRGNLFLSHKSTLKRFYLVLGWKNLSLLVRQLL